MSLLDERPRPSVPCGWDVHSLCPTPDTCACECHDPAPSSSLVTPSSRGEDGGAPGQSVFTNQQEDIATRGSAARDSGPGAHVTPGEWPHGS